MTVGEGGRECATAVTSNPSQWHGVGEEAPLARDLSLERGSVGGEGSRGRRVEVAGYLEPYRRRQQRWRRQKIR